MATATPLAYNPGSPISGTVQVGDLAAGTPTSGFTSSPQFWNGPNQDLGYVIAVPKSGNTQPTPIIVSAPTKLLTLSTTFIGNDINLSNGNQTAYQQFGYQQTVLANAQIDPSSKVMFSVLVNLAQPATLPGSHFIGIGNTNMNYKSNPPYGAYPGSDGNSMGYCSDGNIWYNGAIYATGFNTWTENDVVDVVVDNNTASMWVRVNGGYWNNNDSADPAANTGAFEIIGGPFYPALCPGYEGTMTIQNSAEYGVPSGFTLLGSNETASVGFFRSSALTENSFVELTNNLFSQNFTAATDASTWLTNNGYWNSYGIGFTISSSDFATQYIGYGISGDNTTFTISGSHGSGEAFYGPILSQNAGGSAAKSAEILAYFNANGLTVSNNAYLFNAAWGAGSTYDNCIVVVSFYYYNADNTNINIGTVDITVPGWDTPGSNIYNTVRALPGTFNLPVTLSLYSPLTQDNDNWC